MGCDALIDENDLKEALAQLAVIVDLTNKFEDIYSFRIHMVYQRTVPGGLSCTIHILIGWQSDSYLQRLDPTSSLRAS